MKKYLIILLALLICIPALGSCSGTAEFDFYYESEIKVCLPGETVSVKAFVENISSFTYTYEGCSGDYFPSAMLRPILGDGSLGKALEAEDCIALPTDAVTNRIKSGDRGSHTYEYTLPDGFYGKYALTLLFGGQSKTFYDVIEVIQPARQNESDEYRYSSALVSSGEHGIKPIQGLLWTTQYENGEPTLEGDGDGVYGILRDPETDRNSFPTLVLSDELKITPPEHVSIDGGSIYPIDGDPYADGAEKHPLSDASKLPAGDYIVIFKTYSDTRYGDESIKDYWRSCFECLFRLTVPGGGMQYDYSPVIVTSGDNKINPISLYLATTTYKNGHIISADDGGGADMFFDSDPDQSAFPTITLEGELDIIPPVNYYCTGYRIFDTEFNYLDQTFSSIHELSALSHGTYIVVYYEEYDTRGDVADGDITEYSIVEHHGVFKLIVPEKQ